jgi:hypothetical protein
MGEWTYRSTFFLISALGGGERSASSPGRFTPWERALGTHCIVGWVDPRAGLEGVEKRKFWTLLGLELQLVVSRYTDYAIQALILYIIIIIIIIIILTYLRN